MKDEERKNSRLMRITRREMLVRSAATVTALSMAGTAHAGYPARWNPAGWDRHVKIRAAKDVNPHPHIVEVHLTAAETEVRLKHGVKTRVWAFNGQVPGPRIEVNVGDTLIVHLHNHLPVETSIHWHGVELPAEMDGSNISQLGVPPGETFTYEYKILNAANHWYHPHFRTNEQIDLGLAGPLVLRDPDEDAALGARGVPRHTELTLVLDDMRLDDAGQPLEFATAELETPTGALSPEEIAEEIMNGREGNVILVNGKELPSVKLRRGVAQRWRIINVSNGRFMRLSIPGHIIHRIGGDGGLLKKAIRIAPIDMVPDPDDPLGLISNPDPDVGVLITPSERADIVFTPSGFHGHKLYLEWHDFPRGRHSVITDDMGDVIGLGDDDLDGKNPPRNIMRIKLVGHGHHPPHHLRSRLPRSKHSPLVDIRGDVDVDDIDQALPVFFGHVPPNPNGSVTFFVAVQDAVAPPSPALLNAIRAKTAEVAAAMGAEVPGMVGPPPFMPRPFPAVDNTVALDVKIGDVRFWEVVNFTAADHPFHAHGFFFQPIETLIVHLGDEGAGVPSSIETLSYPLENKDSIRLPARPGALARSWTITRLAVQFDDSARAGSPLGLVRNVAQLEASGKVPGGTGTGHPMLGDSGGWVFHCHINEHADQGMMSFYNLKPA